MSVSPELLVIGECCMSMPLAGKICGEVSLEQLELSLRPHKLRLALSG